MTQIIAKLKCDIIKVLKENTCLRSNDSSK